MTLGRIFKHWLPPVLLAVIALAAWRAANRADFDEISGTPVDYELTLETPMLSARRAPLTLRAPISDEAIAPGIARIARQAPTEQSCLVVRNGDRILGEPKSVPGGLVPASNQKVLTTYAALGILGPDFTYNTRVVATAPIIDGVLTGDLYMIGDGDPFLITDGRLNQYEEIGGRSHTRLEELADQIAATGLTQVTGTLFGDESLYDDVRYGEWDVRLIDQKQSGPLSALTVNEGFSDWPDDFRSSFRGRSETDNPPLNAVSVLNQLLQERGIAFGAAPAVGVAPAGVTDIASAPSPPLLDIVTHINSYSSNIGAELLLKRLGLAVQGVGSTAAGSQVVFDYLTEQGIPMTDVAIFDGSGLDEDNRLTCQAVAAILAGAGPDTPLGISLSIAGQRGSLATRFTDNPADGLVLAKTGTLRGVRALTGYVESAVPTDAEAYVTFAFIVNDQNLLADADVLPLQDQLVAHLTSYPGGPSVAQLSPKPPSVR